MYTKSTLTVLMITSIVSATSLPATASINDGTLFQGLETRIEAINNDPADTGDLTRLAFNPQPEPPRTTNSFVHPGSIVGFNPQPEPPKTRSGFVSPGSKVGFNPQPEPPGIRGGFQNPGSAVGFNPQPEPPKEINIYNGLNAR